jgi:pimeloyl-ACP methyl ester carboxylesterase
MESVGTGPDLVLAHGFAGSARNWRPQVRALRDRYRVTTWDARGHARSPAPPGTEFSLEGLVRDMATVMDRAQIGEPAVIGGLSLGAATALELALLEPNRVRGLILASFPASRSWPGGFGSIADAFAGAIEREGVDAAGARFVWGPDSGLDEAGAALVRQGFVEHDGHSLAAMLRGVLAVLPAPARWAPRLGALGVPVLVIAGGNDAGSLESGRELVAALPDARLEVVEGAGHVVNLARPAEGSELIGSFLDGL